MPEGGPFSSLTSPPFLGAKLRRRMETEAKAKVVASVWRAEFVQIPCRAVFLPRSIWLNSSYSSEWTEAK